MCEKKCDHGHQDKLKVYCTMLAVLIVITGLAILLILAILQPHKPRFILQDATVTALSVSSSDDRLLNCNIQVTVSAENPNERIGIYFERLDIYASYRNQQITLATELPKSYLGHRDTTIWSPYMNGNSVPVSAPMAAALGEDLNAGAVLINIKIDGRIKWKVGSWISGKYRIHVNCPGYLTFASHSRGIADGVGIKYQFVQGCTVEVAAN